MTLGWKVPKFSGGSTILGYYLDKREVHHKNWHEVNSSPVKERILTVGFCLSSAFAQVNFGDLGVDSFIQSSRVPLAFRSFDPEIEVV